MIWYAYIDLHVILPLVKSKKSTTAKPSLDQLQALWPAAKGSLALVYKPCVRPNCPACARGDKHPNYLLSFTEAGRRRCLYVPKPMVPVLERALQNGRKIEELLYLAGPALLKQYRTLHPAQTGPKTKTARSPRSKS
jgi:hypothetical protein